MESAEMLADAAARYVTLWRRSGRKFPAGRCLVGAKVQKEVWREEAIDDVWRETTRRGTNADTNIVVGDDSAMVENTIKKRYRPTFFIPCGASAVEVALAAASTTEGHKASMRRRRMRWNSKRVGLCGRRRAATTSPFFAFLFHV